MAINKFLVDVVTSERDIFKGQAVSSAVLEDLGFGWRDKKWNSACGNVYGWVIQAEEDAFDDQVLRVKMALCGVELKMNLTKNSLERAVEKLKVFVEGLDEREKEALSIYPPIDVFTSVK